MKEAMTLWEDTLDSSDESVEVLEDMVAPSAADNRAYVLGFIIGAAAVLAAC